MDAMDDTAARIGCSTLTFSKLPLGEALDCIQSRGFKRVDIGVIPLYCPHIDPFNWKKGDTERLSRRLAEQELQVSSFNIDAGPLPNRTDSEPTEFVLAALRIAADLGVKRVTLPPGRQAAGETWEDAATKTIKVTREAANAADGLGLRVSIEAPHVGTLADNYERSRLLFERIGDPRVGCTFDTSHARTGDRRPLSEGITLVGADIIHVHLRDTLWGSPNVTPGKGNCDYPPFFEALRNMDYRGDFNFELEYGEVPLAFIQKELDFSRDFMRCAVGGQALLPEYAAWKSKRRQWAELFARFMRRPKATIVSNPRLSKLLRPIVIYARQTLPTRQCRYEGAWRSRWGRGGASHIPLHVVRSESGQRAVNVAIVGCGNIGHNMHAPGFARVPGVKIVGVCDKDRVAAARTANRFGCPAFTSVSELVERVNPHLVANCTKEWTHYDTTIPLLENGVDVFCEKIMAEEVAKGEAMVACAARHRRVLGVNYNWRFLPGIKTIKQVKDSGELGELCLLQIFCHSWVWHHVLDLAEHLGGRAAAVSGVVRQDPIHLDRRPWTRFAGEMAYQPSAYALALLRTAEDVGVSVTSSNLWNPYGCLLNINAVFRKGTVSLSGVRERDAVGIVSCEKDIACLRERPLQGGEPTEFSVTFRRSIDAFMEAYTRKMPVPTSAEDALRIMYIEQAIVEADRTGRRIDVRNVVAGEAL